MHASDHTSIVLETSDFAAVTAVALALQKRDIPHSVVRMAMSKGSDAPVKRLLTISDHHVAALSVAAEIFARRSRVRELPVTKPSDTVEFRLPDVPGPIDW